MTLSELNENFTSKESIRQLIKEWEEDIEACIRVEKLALNYYHLPENGNLKLRADVTLNHISQLKQLLEE